MTHTRKATQEGENILIVHGVTDGSNACPCPEDEDGVEIDGIIWAKYNVDAPGTFAKTPESSGRFYQWNNKGINLTLQNSLLGFTSHRQGYDPYFWCFTWRDFVVNPNKNMKFGSFNNYNHTTVSLEFIPIT